MLLPPPDRLPDQGLMLIAGGLVYTTMAVVFHVLDFLPHDGLETPRLVYNVATGISGTTIGIVMTVRRRFALRRAASGTQSSHGQATHSDDAGH